jgi:hypothetical protein
MSETPKFTPKEQFYASLYRDPAALHQKTLIRRLGIIIPSVALMIAALITRDVSYAILGYGLLLYQAVHSLVLANRGIRTTSGMVAKFEAKTRDEKDAA